MLEDNSSNTTNGVSCVIVEHRIAVISTLMTIGRVALMSVCASNYISNDKEIIAKVVLFKSTPEDSS
jgi:hypothetical protein